jgi:hypothetical protein
MLHSGPLSEQPPHPLAVVIEFPAREPHQPTRDGGSPPRLAV